MRLIIAAFIAGFCTGQNFNVASFLLIFGVAYAVLGVVMGKPKPKAAPRQARPAKRRSFRSAFVSSASDGVSRGIASILMPRKPTAQEMERERQRRDAESKYWFHQKQADRLRGTRDGEWHQNQAYNYRNKMR